MPKWFRATIVYNCQNTCQDANSVRTFAAEKEAANDPVLYQSGEEEVTARSLEDGRLGGSVPQAPRSVPQAPRPVVFSSRETRAETVERGSGTGRDRSGIADASKYHSNRTPSMVFSSRRFSGREAGQWV